MDAEFITREYRQKDAEEIVELLCTVFEGWPKIDISCTPLEHWRWKYQDNYLNWRPICVSEIDGKIIGVTHTLPQKIKIFENIILAAVGGDVAVYKEHRRSGVWSRLLEIQYEQRKRAGIKFSYLATSNPIVIKRFDKSPGYYRLPLDLIYYIRIRDLDLHIENNPIENAWIQKIGYQTLKTMSDLKKLISSSDKHNSNIQINDVKKFDENVEKFWGKIKNHYNLIVESDQKYLNWRYCDSRAGSFLVKQASENGEIVGFICLMINRIRPDYPVGTIAELLYLPERTDVLELLLSESVDFFDKNNINIVVFASVKYPQLNEALERKGFLDSRTNYNIFYNLLTEEDDLKRAAQSSLEKQHFVHGTLI